MEENPRMTMGGLIPAGTGFEFSRNVRIPADEPLPPSPEELSREMRLRGA
jgi:diacylglycerol kinase family enzyme